MSNQQLIDWTFRNTLEPELWDFKKFVHQTGIEREVDISYFTSDSITVCVHGRDANAEPCVELSVTFRVVENSLDAPGSG